MKFKLLKGNPVAETISEEEAEYWAKTFDRLMKIGIEIEMNIKEEKTGNCLGAVNSWCPCTAVHKVKTKDNNGVFCFNVCANHLTCEKRKGGNCSGILCLDFQSPCDTCKQKENDCSKCKYYKNPNKTPSGIRNLISQKLGPTCSYTKFGKTGVVNVIDDGSLSGEGGVEVITNGRRVDYYLYLDQLNNIYKELGKHNTYVDEKTSIHYHVLLEYYKNYNTNELEKPIPGIILRNMHQIFRIFENALVWISSSGNTWEHLTRWSKFRMSIANLSGVHHNSFDLIQNTCRLSPHKSKYSLINYSHMRSKSNKELSIFHYEARFADGNKSPAAVAAFATLLYAITRKAIDLSMYGVLGVPRKYYDENNEMKKYLLNQGEDDSWAMITRKAQTEQVKKHKDYYVQLTKNLISFVRPYLNNWSESAEVLTSLAERPCSVRLIEGEDWDMISRELEEMGSKKKHITNKDLAILKFIDLNILTSGEQNDVVEEISNGLGIEQNKVAESIEKLINANKIDWNSETKTLTRK